MNSAISRNINNNYRNGRKLYFYGFRMLLGGFISILMELLVILIQLLNLSLYDAISSDFPLKNEDLLYFQLIIGIGLISILLFFLGLWLLFKKNSGHGRRLTYWMVVFLGLAINASLLFGGGWFIGVILSDLGIFLILYSIFRHYKGVEIGEKQVVPQKKDHSRFKESRKGKKARDGKEGRDRGEGEENGKSKNRIFSASTIFSGIILLAVIISAIIPYFIIISRIPEPLFPDSSAPASDIVPNRTNTFYILPIMEWNPSEQDMAYMKRVLGGDDYTGDGFIKIGRSVSCWYTNSLYENGSFNPTNLIQKLNISASTETPILFHMNGGNWGQASSQNPVILAMRENISNCQWDQMDVCHPIGYNSGPNDRFWSFAPNTEWEYYRERNIKQALSIIYKWWQEHPDLLVGFSTDSEIHLNYHEFEDINEGGYKSRFDYNPLTIQQYREWVQANWTLEEFNELCGTDFTSWDEVDAPRDASVVDNKGHPWWEMWTDFRIWHVWEAGRRQCRWMYEMGFPRDMIWHHQILSEPDSVSARYIRCDPIETAINPYCQVGVTRYDWIDPETWNSLGLLDMQERNSKTPSWGIFEWNLWRNHQYSQYMDSLKMIYQYGARVICPNEYVNCSINEGLWIPGDDCEKEEPYEEDGVTYGSDECGCGGSDNSTESCCIERDEYGNCTHWVYKHGNPQFQAALRDFIKMGQNYERGTCPDLRVNKQNIYFYTTFDENYKYFSRGGLYIMGSLYLIILLYDMILSVRISSLLKVKRKENVSLLRKKRNNEENTIL